MPGLVDVHTHPGTEGPGQQLDEALLRRHFEAHRDAGVTLTRSPGLAGPLPADVAADITLPRMRTAGPWLAAPGRFFAGWGRQVELDRLPAAAEEEARRSAGWCKVIADWSYDDDRGVRRYGPSVPPEVLAEVVRRVHAAGGRVAVHSQHGDSGAAAVAAGADSLEHGMHLPTDLLDTMASQGTALVPTLIAFATHPRSDREALGRFMIAGFERHPELVRAAHEAGVTLLAGTDSLPHGNVAAEVAWLARCGVPAETALAAASWTARRFMGLPGLEEGAPADLVAYDRDPRTDLSVLHEPTRIILRGQIVR